MKQRGKKASALSVVEESPISAKDRPEPPVDLTPEQRIEWILVVNSLRPEWFPPETHAVLAQYCKHVVTSKHIAELIRRLENEKTIDVDEYERLLKMQERESRIIVSLATKMRLTQQASYHPDKTKEGKGKVKSPWDQ